VSQAIAYLINQYPKVSHSFIRREIIGIEAYGISVARWAIRSSAVDLVDAGDQQELVKTRAVLGVGMAGLISSLFRVMIAKPLSFLKALKLALSVGWGSERGILFHLAYLAEACVILQWSQAENISHVHAHFGTNSTTVAMLCQALGGPAYSFTIHGPDEFDHVNGLSIVEKVKRAAFVVTISSFSRSQLYRWCKPEQWSKIHVVHCGVDSEFLAQQPVPIPSPPKFVCVGRLCEAKGQLLLINAVKQLAAEGLKFKLLLVGDGELRCDIESLIAEFGLEDWVEITGWASSSQVRQYIQSARVMVLPSFAEGLPVVIMEALALGRPVISTYIAGIPELVEPGVCGWLIPSGSVEALTSAMREALQLPITDLEQMGNAGRARVLERHDIKIESGKLVALLSSSPL
jgi:colanic acid/amylovoran biosynthesis glycosyltransferase